MTSQVEQSLSQSENVDHRRDARIIRQQNHLRFLSNFQSIIEKYERNFNEVGDEIDLRTLEVSVDNGHLQAMCNDKDTGIRDSCLLKSQHQDDQDTPKRNLITLPWGARQELPEASSDIYKSIVHCFSGGFDVGTANDLNDIKNSRVRSAGCQPANSLTDQSSGLSPSLRIGSHEGRSRFCSPTPLPTLYPSSVEELGRNIAFQISGFLQHCQTQSLTSTEEDSPVCPNYPRLRNAPHSSCDLKENKMVNPLSSTPRCEPREHNPAPEQSIWNYDLHPGYRTPGHVSRSHSPKLSKEDELIIKLKYREHMNWSEIKKYFPDAEKFATARNRWYAQLSKRYPHDGRVKCQRRAMGARNHFSRAAKRTYSAKTGHDKPLTGSTPALATLLLSPHSSEDVQRDIDMRGMDERCSQHNQEHDDSSATCEQPQAVAKPDSMAVVVNPHDSGFDTTKLHRGSNHCSLEVIESSSGDAAYKSQNCEFQGKKSGKFRHKGSVATENQKLRGNAISSKSAIQFGNDMGRFPTATASPITGPAKQKINLRQKHDVLAYEDSEDELAL